jgi:hypothetical protein
VAYGPFERLASVRDRHAARHMLDELIVIASHEGRIRERHLFRRLRRHQIGTERFVNVVDQAWLKMSEAHAVEHSGHLLKNSNAHKRRTCNCDSACGIDSKPR